MHLLATTPLEIADGSGPVLLVQSPGDIVVLSAAASELACLAEAQANAPEDAPSLRLASLLDLGHNLAVDHYVDTVARQARLIVVRLLGGRAYWPHGVERLVTLCRKDSIPLALLGGDERADEELIALSTLGREQLARLQLYLAEGGSANARNFLLYCTALLGRAIDAPPPVALPRSGMLERRPARAADQPAPRALIVFYRALVQAGDLAPIEALAAALNAEGLDVVPAYVTSLREASAASFIAALVEAERPDIVLNATAFSMGGDGRSDKPLFGDAPVIQVTLAGATRAAWLASARGLGSKDIAMHVALPEVDGRIHGRAISFKAPQQRDPRSETSVVRHAPEADRVAFVTRLAAGWARLRRTRPAERRLALVLANYPNRDGRLGNGVGLDVPASALALIEALEAAGYDTRGRPIDAAALMARLAEGPTNDLVKNETREATLTLPRVDYDAFFATLPLAARAAVSERWGEPACDPFFRSALDAFALPAFRCGNLVIAVQPARGYNIDPTSSYHDPALPPPHSYLAFHAWLRERFDAHAIVQLGKHGNLEWLPGKGLALSAACFPEIALGPVPLIYPFIVNDPGEGAQAKRRASAVIVDHLMPPLTRAGGHGELGSLETLIDEYYEAASLDPRRLRPLAASIIERARSASLDSECEIARDEPLDSALKKLDGYLCELKDRQIRNGLHVLGRSPEGHTRAETLAAFARAPRGSGKGEASLLRALSEDLALGLDPLMAEPGTTWAGPRPAVLEALSGSP